MLHSLWIEWGNRDRDGAKLDSKIKMGQSNTNEKEGFRAAFSVKVQITCIMCTVNKLLSRWIYAGAVGGIGRASKQKEKKVHMESYLFNIEGLCISHRERNKRRLKTREKKCEVDKTKIILSLKIAIIYRARSINY